MRSSIGVASTLAVMLATSPAIAQERWTHPASGASLPKTFEAQAIADQRDLGTPNDSVVDYEAASGTESTTFYIFKASVPNARLWFDRAMPVVASQIPIAIFDAGPLEPIAAFGSASPNGLRQIFVARQAGPFRSTALVVVQSGPWIVKMRATSATLDRGALAARIDRRLAAMRIAPAQFDAGLEPLPRCATAPPFGQGRPVSDGVERAAAYGIAIHARLHGPAMQFCLADTLNSRFTMLGVADQPSSWLLLMGEAVGSEAIGGQQGADRYLVYASSPAGTRGAALFDAPPTLDAAGMAAAPLLSDPAAGLFGITVSAGAEPVTVQR